MHMWLSAYRRAWAHETPEEALAFFARVFDEAPAAIVVTEPNFALTDANIAAQQLLRTSLDALRGRLFHNFVDASDRTAFGSIARQMMSEPERVTRPLLLRATDGRQVEVSLTACALRDQNGTPEMIVLMLLERGEQISSDIL